MDEFEVNVTVRYKDESEDEIEVFISLNEFGELETSTERIEYIKNLAIKSSEDIKKVLFDKDNLKDLEMELDDMNDTSDLLPNESYEEFMEHEDF